MKREGLQKDLDYLESEYYRVYHKYPKREGSKLFYDAADYCNWLQKTIAMAELENSPVRLERLFKLVTTAKATERKNNYDVPERIELTLSGSIDRYEYAYLNSDIFLTLSKFIDPVQSRITAKNCNYYLKDIDLVWSESKSDLLVLKFKYELEF